MATRLLGARLNLLSAREVLNARDRERSDGGGLLLRCAGPRAAWVFRYTSTSGKRREMGLGACVRHNTIGIYSGFRHRPGELRQSFALDLLFLVMLLALLAAAFVPGVFFEGAR